MPWAFGICDSACPRDQDYYSRFLLHQTPNLPLCKSDDYSSLRIPRRKFPMATTKKALELAAELADELRKRVSDYGVITESVDANGHPTISLTADSTPATTEDNVFIRVKPIDWALAKDVLGNAQTVYTPHVIQLAVEAPASGVGLARFVSIAHAWAILNACGQRGCEFQYWEETNGSIPAATTFDTANKQKASFSNLYWNMLSQQ